MRSARLILISTAIAALLLSHSPAQDGTAERIGRRIGEGLEELTEEVQQAWADVQKSVDQLGVQGRVYGRLRWDKALAEEPLGVDVPQEATVVLTGRVPDEETRQKAVRLAEDTVGVREVIDQLRIKARRAQ